MSDTKETNAFIKKVHLKGFKSIKDLEVRLNNGLNIIIGPNGSGKTNFVEFLSYLLNDLLNSKKDLSLKQSNYSNIKFQIQEEEFEIKIINDIVNINQSEFSLSNEIRTHTLLIHESKEVVINNRFQFVLELSTISKSAKINPVKIPFTIPADFGTYMLSGLGQLYIQRGGEAFIINILQTIFESNLTVFASNFMENNYEIVDQDIYSVLKISYSLLDNLNKFSPIKNLKLSDSLSFLHDKKSLKINYLMLEFYVNNSWLTWAELSDGTKRIFHIISEINYKKGLILIEEPENGVHPDQLYKLMDFFKEQAKEKQIIITTHSPEVLNILEKDELDRIIVTRYEEGKGTLMHHLNEKTKKKALWYMENKGMLSDCWVHTKSFEQYDAADSIA